MSFQKKIFEFEKLIKGMIIPEERKEITPMNVYWLIRNLKTENSNNPNFQEVMKMLNEWNSQIAKGKKFLS